MFNRFTKITVIIFVGVFLVFGMAKAITLKDFSITPNSIPTGTSSTMTYSLQVTSTEQEVISECSSSTGGSNFYWEIQRQNVAPQLKVAKSGSIRASDFLASGVKDIRGTFTERPLTDITSVNYQFIIGCGFPQAGITKRLSADLTIVNVTGQAQGWVSIKFDANPKSVQPGSSNNFNFTLGITAKQSDVEDKCRDDQVTWRVYMFPADGADNFTNPIQSGAVRSTEFGTGKTVPQNFSKTINALDRSFIFKARLTCDVSFGSDILTTSDPVPIQSGGAGPGACNNNGKCDSGETSFTCISDCPSAPGQDQTYSFEIPNPFRGGADNFTDLVKIIAQWIFNLAIPIAVAMIVYSGILFLTAAGEPAKVTKAKDVLKYAVIGLAIIMIGSGFVTLIQSVLELGGTGEQTEEGPPEPGGPPVYGPPAPGVVGNKCSGDRDCLTGLKCQDTICKRATGNWVNEPCSSTRNCDVGLTCDRNNPQPPIDGQSLGVCIQTVGTGGNIGVPCQSDNQCMSGLKCNQICQRSGGNLNGEVCLKTANPSNCNSRACNTSGTATEGVCVPYSGT